MIALRAAARLGLFVTLFAAALHTVPASATTYTVSNTNDSGNGSLRKAIADANAHIGADTIWLIIGTGEKTINLSSQLPDVTDAVLIDGWVQPGFSSAPLIRIDGGAMAANSTGLRIYAGATTLRGLTFTRFGTAVIVGGGDSISFRGCYFGTTGAAAFGNQTGIRLYAGTNITVGGSGATDGNVISGNTSYGMYIDPAIAGLTLKGNRIGTNAAGTAALGNGSAGVRSFASNVIVGGATAAERNLFSGNGSDGLAIEAGSVGITIRGNYFGLDATGTLDLVNEAGAISADALHRSVLVTMQSEFAAVATTEEWTLAVEAGDTLPVSNLWDSTGHARLPEKHAELHKLMREVRAGIDDDIAATEAHNIQNTLYVGQGVSSL